MKRPLILIALLALCIPVLSAGEKGLMHCFTFTEVESATPADWQAFAKATDELPGKIPGLQHLMHGKLVRPLSLMMSAAPMDAETSKKYRAGESVSAEVKMGRRQYGVCMHFASEDAFKAYGKDPAHDAWAKAYEKVRVPGTTTFQMIGK